ncbi:hypothetical protein EV46_06685 [Pectobacterium atrosepticum]|nr:hypothetical protein EV46_06685 [Pectobacterium atrosepticum]
MARFVCLIDCECVLFGVFLTILFTTQTNDTLWALFGKKLVDAIRPTTHNAPRNADEGDAKKMAT